MTYECERCARLFEATANPEGPEETKIQIFNDACGMFNCLIVCPFCFFSHRIA